MTIRATQNPKVPFSMFALTVKNFMVGAFKKKPIPKLYKTAISEKATGGLTLKEAAQKRGVFIGAAIGDVDSPAVQELFPNHFNSATAENAMKWGELRKSLAGSYDFSKADAIVDYALSHHARMRGHTLVWGKFPGHGSPKDIAEVLNKAEDPRKMLMAILEEHIFTVMEHFKGRVLTWDVVNEPFELFGANVDQSVFHQVLGLDFIPLAFSLARQADPNVKLFLNETIYNYSDKKAANFLKLIRDLRAQNVPIDGIGLQSHMMTELPSLPEFRNYTKQLAELGFEIELTELDASISLFRKEKNPYQAQSDFYREYIGACLESGACKGITFWGMYDRDNWMDQLPPLIPFRPNNPLLFDEDMFWKPAYDGVLEALRK